MRLCACGKIASTGVVFERGDAAQDFLMVCRGELWKYPLTKETRHGRVLRHEPLPVPTRYGDPEELALIRPELSRGRW